VSSTHIAVGAIFGVGFFREWDAERRLKKAHQSTNGPKIAPEERRRRKLVRRSHVLTIGAAWVFTVPAAAILSMLIF
ncbi:inorganic phosphate transporter, partial [Ochrobactrum sp. SFR4]